MYSLLELKKIKKRAAKEAKIKHPISQRDKEWRLACLNMVSTAELLMLMVESSLDDKNHEAHLAAHRKFLGLSEW